MTEADEATIALLSHVSLFEGCSVEELAVVASVMTDSWVEAGADVTAQGQPGNAAFVIVEGVARVEVNGQKLADLGAGDFFGEVALLDGGDRTATVVAESPILVLSLDRSQLEKLVREVPPVALAMLRELARRLRHANEMIT